jgi:hypothetical protein
LSRNRSCHARQSGSRLYSLKFNKGDSQWRTNEEKVAKAEAEARAVAAVNKAAAAAAAKVVVAVVRVAALVAAAVREAAVVAVVAVPAVAVASPADANTNRLINLANRLSKIESIQ